MAFAREKDMAPIVTAWLRAQGMLVLPWQAGTQCGITDLAACVLNLEMAERRLHRKRGWRPLHTRLVAVELKLDYVRQAIRQARGYQCAFEETYVALPRDRAEAVVANRRQAENLSRLHAHGIGLLGVSERDCAELLPAVKCAPGPLQAERQANKFYWEWRRSAQEATP